MALITLKRFILQCVSGFSFFKKTFILQSGFRHFQVNVLFNDLHSTHQNMVIIITLLPALQNVY